MRIRVALILVIWVSTQFACSTTTNHGDAVVTTPSQSIWGTVAPVLELPQFDVTKPDTYHFEVREVSGHYPSTIVLIDKGIRSPGWRKSRRTAPWESLQVRVTVSEPEGRIVSEAVLDFNTIDTSAFWIDRESMYPLQLDHPRTPLMNYDVNVTIVEPAGAECVAFICDP